jgi:uncharacterized protein (TIGR03905 family)
MFEFRPSGVCSRLITFDVEDNKVKGVQFFGGCPGNTLGIAQLVEGRPVEEIISLLQGINCGRKPTSCPDQLAQALKAWKEQQ